MYYNIRNTFGTNLPVDFSSFFVLCTCIYIYIYICLCFLCIVICMHSFDSAHIFNYGHIVKLYSHFVYSPLNSYVYIHWILDLNIYYYYQIWICCPRRENSEGDAEF